MKVREQLVYVLLAAVGATLTAAFGLAWFDPANISRGFTGRLHFLDVLEFVAVSWIVWQQIAMQLFLWLTATSIKRPLQMTPLPGYRVAFISTFVPGSESLDLLHQNLPAMVSAEYPHDTWLLDEGNSSEVRKICEAYGVRYFTRAGIPRYNMDSGSFAARTKGGNHNAWYDANGSQYDIVAQIDIDFTPRQDFLLRTLGYFNDPSVAFVGTPQVYGNIARSRIARGAAEKLYAFYGPIMQGMSGVNSALMIGANHVVRVSALREIGFYAGHITEDLLTGMTIHTMKWKSVYVPETLAVGEGPTTWTAYFNQQMRWAYGCIHILVHHSPRLLVRMGPRRLLRYFVLQQYYFAGLSLGLGIALLLVYFVTGHAPSAIHVKPIVEFYLPVLAWQVVIAWWLRRFSVDPVKKYGIMLHGVLASIAVIPIYLLAFFSVVRGKRLVFKVTPKGEGAIDRGRESIQTFVPHLIIGLISTCGVCIGFALGHSSPLLVFWGVLTATSMFGLVGVVIAQETAELGTLPVWVRNQLRRSSRLAPQVVLFVRPLRQLWATERWHRVLEDVGPIVGPTQNADPNLHGLGLQVGSE